MSPIQQEQLKKRRERNLKKKASPVPTHLAWFSALPLKHRAAIKKAYEVAKAMKSAPF